MLLSMIAPTVIAAIFYEVAVIAIALLQFDIIHFCDATRSANIFVFVS
jgi:hypothetical protein